MVFINNYLKIVVILLLGAAVASCAEPSSNALKDAQQSFSNQNYGYAFKKLRSAARYHDRRVEYALGYCYYYGIGTTANPALARYYISRSAWQVYAPAMRAMSLFDRPAPVFDNGYSPTYRGHIPSYRAAAFVQSKRSSRASKYYSRSHLPVPKSSAQSVKSKKPVPHYGRDKFRKYEHNTHNLKAIPNKNSAISLLPAPRRTI